jgi:integrase
MPQHPKHCQMHNGSYRVRVVVPVALQQVIGAKVLRSPSLKTDSPKLAEKLARPFILDFEARINAARPEPKRWMPVMHQTWHIPLPANAPPLPAAYVAQLDSQNPPQQFGERLMRVADIEPDLPLTGYTYMAAIADWKKSRGDDEPEDTTEEIYTAHLKRLFDRLGHDQMGNVSPEDVIAHPQVLLSGSDGGRVVGNKSVNNHMSSIRAVFRVAKFNRRIADDPTVGTVRKLKVKKNPETSRLGFSRADHQRIFAEARKAHNLAIRWLWVIGCLTGARIGELADATVSAVRQVGGVWCFDINESYRGWRVKKNGKRVRVSLKTEGSPRVLPLHSEILKAGFLEYVESVKTDDPDAPLFPMLDKLSRFGKRSVYASRITNNWLDDHLGMDDPRYCFHSTRHAIKTYLAGRVEDRVSNAITGHDDGTVANHYGETEIAVMQRAIEQIRVLA